jgi:hypothetical protein
MSVLVFDTRKTRKQLAQLPAVQAAVEALTLEIGVAAEALFASHDHPGGHHIEVDKAGTDGFVSLVGPAALSVEFGHFAGSRDDVGRRYVKGLHILSRAARL